MKFLCKLRVGWRRAFELQVFETDRLWLRLTRDPERNALAFWSAASESNRDWRAVAIALDGRLADVPANERSAIYSATTFFPTGWDFWGPCVPAPIATEVLSGEIEEAAAAVPVSEFRGE